MVRAWSGWYPKPSNSFGIGPLDLLGQGRARRTVPVQTSLFEKPFSLHEVVDVLDSLKTDHIGILEGVP